MATQERVSTTNLESLNQARLIMKKRTDGMIIFSLGCAAFLLLGLAWKHVSPIAMGDFKVVYYSARCLIHGNDPYKEVEVLRVYQAEGRELPSEKPLNRQVMTRYFYLPTAFAFTLPFALLGFGIGHVLWMICSAGSLIVAAFLMFDLGAEFAPTTSGLLLCVLLMGSFWLFMIGNSAAIVVSLCVIAVWCFVRARFVFGGIVCLAISLALKPHDSGLVWIYFLLAGGIYRKHALQTLALLITLCLPAVLWVTHVAPHWMQEMNANMSSFAGVGGITDPGPAGNAGIYMDSFVQLQSALSIFWQEPRTYNLIAYTACGLLLLIWAFITLRVRPSQSRILIALAAIAPLSMLPIYHMQHDAKLLLLTVPACAMLWVQRGFVGWLSLCVTSAGILISGDIFTGFRILVTRNLSLSQADLLGQTATVLITRPAPIILMVMAVFYLWVYARTSRDNALHQSRESANDSPMTKIDQKIQSQPPERGSRTR